MININITIKKPTYWTQNEIHIEENYNLTSTYAVRTCWTNLAGSLMECLHNRCTSILKA